MQASSRAGAALRHGSLLLSQFTFRLPLMSDCSGCTEAAELLKPLTKAGPSGRNRLNTSLDTDEAEL